VGATLSQSIRAAQAADGVHDVGDELLGLRRNDFQPVKGRVIEVVVVACKQLSTVLFQ
jgi:hypothetical protein